MSTWRRVAHVAAAVVALTATSWLGRVSLPAEPTASAAGPRDAAADVERTCDALNALLQSRRGVPVSYHTLPSFTPRLVVTLVTDDVGRLTLATEPYRGPDATDLREVVGWLP